MTTISMRRAVSRRLLAACAAAAMSLAAGVAHAQLSTATIGGVVTENGRVAPGAAVTVTQQGTNFTVHATADADGRYVIPGLRPGSYVIQAKAPDGSETTQVVVVQVGQSASVDLALGNEVKEVVVKAAPRQATDVRTTETATNVTQQQIEDLPQSSRNFLNFADLAPGVRTTSAINAYRNTFDGGANGSPNGNNLESSQTNVYIDGVSYKSNVQQGGIVGQDFDPRQPLQPGRHPGDAGRYPELQSRIRRHRHGRDHRDHQIRHERFPWRYIWLLPGSEPA